MESFNNYKAGDFDVEDTRSLFASGALRRADTIDDNFGFSFRAFPDPFNAPYVRTSKEIPNSGARGRFLNLSGLVKLADRRTLRLRYQRRRMDAVGFSTRRSDPGGTERARRPRPGRRRHLSTVAAAAGAVASLARGAAWRRVCDTPRV